MKKNKRINGDKQVAYSSSPIVPRKGVSPINGLTVTQFFEMIFKSNEALPKSSKLTDQRILAEWERLFGGDWPKVPNKERRDFLLMRLQKLRYYRKQWNKGLLYRGQVVRVVSWRYNSEGNRVDFSDGVTPLTKERMTEWVQYFKQKAGSQWRPYA